MSGIFKELYRGRGIYCFPTQGYGDETRPLFKTLRELKDNLDIRTEKERAERFATSHLIYWDSLTDVQRREWRHRMDWDSDLSVSEQAYADHLTTTRQETDKWDND